jgi:superfamily II DNA/RNA helicase
LNQGLRNRRLMALREGHVQILVATDVAARGIDVPTITHVFNFGLPMKAEDYTHRIGRTGRAGRDGLAVTFAEFRDRRKIFDIEAYSRQPIKAEVVPGLEPKQRFPESRPGSNFGGRLSHGNRGGQDGFSRDRKFGGHRSGGFDAPRGPAGGFGGNYPEKSGFSQRQSNPDSYQNSSNPASNAWGGESPYQRKGGFNDRFAKPAHAQPTGAKPAGARAFKPAPGPKVFDPRGAKKRPARAA